VFFETSLDAVSWYQLPVTPISGASAVTSTAAPGLFVVSVAGLALVRARLGGVVTGAVSVIGLGTAASL
jgi:hypothetical protein